MLFVFFVCFCCGCFSRSFVKMVRLRCCVVGRRRCGVTCTWIVSLRWCLLSPSTYFPPLRTVERSNPNSTPAYVLWLFDGEEPNIHNDRQRQTAGVCCRRQKITTDKGKRSLLSFFFHRFHGEVLRGDAVDPFQCYTPAKISNAEKPMRTGCCSPSLCA